MLAVLPSVPRSLAHQLLDLCLELGDAHMQVQDLPQTQVTLGT